MSFYCISEIKSLYTCYNSLVGPECSVCVHVCAFYMKLNDDWVFFLDNISKEKLKKVFSEHTNIIPNVGIGLVPLSTVAVCCFL